MPRVITQRIKAVVAFLVAGAATYAATAVSNGDPLTVHGLEVAAVAAALTGLGVHTAPANKPKPRRRAKRAP